MTSEQVSLLEVDDLNVEFEIRGGTVRAVSGVSFCVRKREVLAIVGESGSGKSCTARAILRLIPSPPGRLSARKIEFNGINLLDLRDNDIRKVRGRQISLIFQDPLSSLNPLFTVGTQIGEVLRVHMGLDKKATRRRCLELLKLVEMPDPERQLKSYPHQLSGGMRQRVMIAMCLACDPELLIADEPTTALDVTIQAQIVDLVKRLRSDVSMSIIWITHDLGIVAGLADRVIVMYAGQIVEEANVDSLFGAPLHPYTIGLLDSLPRVDESRSGKLRTIGGSPPDLEQLPAGCSFEPRCSRATSKCRVERPPLELHDSQHRVACWNVADTKLMSDDTPLHQS